MPSSRSGFVQFTWSSEQTLGWSLVLLLDINVTSLFVHLFWISVRNIVIQIIVFRIAAKTIILHEEHDEVKGTNL